MPGLSPHLQEAQFWPNNLVSAYPLIAMNAALAYTMGLSVSLGLVTTIGVRVVLTMATNGPAAAGIV